MSEKFEKIYQIEKPEVKKEKIEIDKDLFEDVKAIAKIVGGDFGMKIEAIPAGKRPPNEPIAGTYCNPETATVVFDPADLVKERRTGAEMIAGHEGAHRAISRGPVTIGLKKEVLKELGGQVGFAYLDNAIEDPAVNNWAMEKFPRLGQTSFKKTYDEMLKKEKVPLGCNHPDVLRIIRRTGNIPNLVWVGSEIIRFWHTKKFSQGLSPEVRNALAKTIRQAKKSYATVPSDWPSEKEIIDKARERFSINYEKVWPNVRPLVEEDLKNENRRQMLEKMLKDLAEEDFEKMTKDLEKGQTGTPLDKLNEKQRKELADLIKKGQEQMKKIQEEMPREVGEKMPEKPEGLPVPMNEMEKDLKKELDEAFEKLSEEDKKKIKEKVEKLFKDLEDGLNKQLEAKLNKDNKESHAERDKRLAEETEKKALAEKEKREEEAVKKAQEELVKRMESQLSEYDRYYRDLKEVIQKLYVRLSRIFEPEKHPKWKAGYPAGLRVSLKKLMEYQRDRAKYTELWERKTLPQKFDYRFSILVDLSSSMDGENIDQAFKALVVILEALAHFENIKIEVAGFQERNDELKYRVYKEFEDKLDKKTRERVGQILGHTAGSTPTAEATIVAAQRLHKNEGKDNFIITLTDGGPNNEDALNEVVDTIKQKTDYRLIGLGIGEGTEAVEKFYGKGSKGNLAIEELPNALANLIEDIIKHPSQYAAKKQQILKTKQLLKEFSKLKKEIKKEGREEKKTEGDRR